MDERASFEQAIWEEPLCNTRRLAFADYLDEVGGEVNQAHAELIRTQIRVATRPRPCEILINGEPIPLPLPGSKIVFKGLVNWYSTQYKEGDTIDLRLVVKKTPPGNFFLMCNAKVMEGWGLPTGAVSPITRIEWTMPSLSNCDTFWPGMLGEGAGDRWNETRLIVKHGASLVKFHVGDCRQGQTPVVIPVYKNYGPIHWERGFPTQLIDWPISGILNLIEDGCRWPIRKATFNGNLSNIYDMVEQTSLYYKLPHGTPFSPEVVADKIRHLYKVKTPPSMLHRINRDTRRDIPLALLHLEWPNCKFGATGSL
jgi:uncharacterized protein (TIGR02996 family)